MIKKYGKIILGFGFALCFGFGILPLETIAQTTENWIFANSSENSIFPAINEPRYSTSTLMNFNDAVQFCATMGKRLPYYSEINNNYFNLASTTYYDRNVSGANIRSLDRPLVANQHTQVFRGGTVDYLTATNISDTSTGAVICVENPITNTTMEYINGFSYGEILIGSFLLIILILVFGILLWLLVKCNKYII